MYLGGGEKPSPWDYSQLLRAVVSRPDRHVLQTMLIRSMMQAVYQTDNIGHFGLGFPAYTHFTSPIRRYPDLLVHRAIRYLIRNKPGAHLQKKPEARKLSKKTIYPYGGAEMDRFGVHCSAAERRADAASYSVIDWLKCEYMLAHVGDGFLGTITSVTSFGLFVELDDIYIEGLVHVSELSNDYYHFDPARHCLEGERSKQAYRLGDRLEVKVVRVDLEEKKIDLQVKKSRGKNFKANKSKKGNVKVKKKLKDEKSKSKPKVIKSKLRGNKGSSDKKKKVKRKVSGRENRRRR